MTKHQAFAEFRKTTRCLRKSCPCSLQGLSALYLGGACFYHPHFTTTLVSRLQVRDTCQTVKLSPFGIVQTVIKGKERTKQGDMGHCQKKSLNNKIAKKTQQCDNLRI